MTAVVAGASSAIGRAIAVDLARDGHDLVLWGRDRTRLDETASAVRAEDRHARVEAFDLADRRALDVAAAACAGVRVAVWAAGTFDFGSHDEADPDAIEDVLHTVLVAAARAARGLLPHLLEPGEGRASLVLIGSGADRIAYPGNAAYVAAKHGLRGLADALHLDVAGRGVRVTLVSPGLVSAGSGALAPFAQEHPELLLRPEDVATAVRFVVGFPGPGSVLHVDLVPGLPA